MHSTYHWEKTFGIRNETLVNLAGIFFIFSSTSIFVFLGCETIIFPAIYHLRQEEPKFPVSFGITASHFLTSLLIILFAGLNIVCSEEEKLTKKQSIRLGCITIFHILFLFNPWIAKSQKYAEKFYVDAHYTEKLHYIFFYCWVVVAAFICWLPWKNQSKRERPTYKVIYGDEDSVTKKMLNEKLV